MPEPPVPPPLLTLTLDDSYRRESAPLREQALDLAKEGHFSTALPIFEALCALEPANSDHWSDVGVTLMRMGEWSQAWSAFGRALVHSPQNSLAIKNRDELRSFLGDGNPIMTAPPPPMGKPLPRRTPREREHETTPVANASALPSDSRWWAKPLVLLAADEGGRSVEPGWVERALIERLTRRGARFYVGGLVSPHSPAAVRPVVESWRWLRMPAGRAGRALVTIALNGRGPDAEGRRGAGRELEWALERLNMAAPAFETQHPAAVQPSASCLHALQRAGQTGAFAQLVYRQTLVVSAAPGAGQFVHADRIGTASWQLQVRGVKRWQLCPPVAGCGVGSIDLFDPDYRHCPALRNASCWEATLHAREAIYVPPGYSMQTSSVTHGSVAIGGSVVVRENAPAIARLLRSSCETRETVPWDAAEWGLGGAEAQTTLCGAMQTCLDEWEQLDAAQ